MVNLSRVMLKVKEPYFLYSCFLRVFSEHGYMLSSIPI